MTVELLRLSDEGCLDQAAAGGKAARLALAFARGLPVLPGFVIPAAESVPALRQGLARLPSEGIHGARFAVGEPSPSRLAGALRLAAELGDALVVRSSSPFEGAATWSGAFTSFLDVRPGELLTAVRGVWASALCDDVLARSGHHQVAAEDAGLAVLVQPFVDPDFSGTAEVGADGTVKVVAVKGAPAPLMTGWHPGVTGRCGADGGAEGEQALALLGVPLLQAVAELARAVRARVGDNAIEWAALDGRPLLLQSRTVSRADHERAGGVAEHAGGDLPAHAEAVVLRVLEYAGPTGEDLVLPWLLAGPPAAARRAGRPAAGRAPSPSPRHAWRRAQAMCEMLTAGAWPRGGKAAAASALSELRAGRVRSALARFERLPSADPDLAGEAIALLRQVADGLAQVGAIDHPGSLWALPPGAVSRLLEHPAPTGVAAHRGGAARRWEGLAFSVLVSTGNEARGEAASGGIGAGQPLLVEGRPERVELPPRAVVVAPLPLPHLAPLLWGASALVTFGGGAAAHLIEVANSLSVPAVVGCAGAERLVREGDGRRLAAVDGNTGTVWFGRTT